MSYEEGCRSSILLRINSEFLHSRKQSRAVHSQARSSTIGTAGAPLACDECLFDLIALFSCIFVSNTGPVVLRIFFSFSTCLILRRSACGTLPYFFSDLCERGLQRLAARQDHGPLDEIFELTNVSGPVPRRQPFHYGRRNSFDRLLHLPGKLLDEIAHQQRNIFFAFPQRGHRIGNTFSR